MVTVTGVATAARRRSRRSSRAASSFWSRWRISLDWLWVTSLGRAPMQRRGRVKLHTPGLQWEPGPAGEPGASRSACHSRGRAGAGGRLRRESVPAGAEQQSVPACQHQGSQRETSGERYPACLRIVGSNDSSVVSSSHWPVATRRPALKKRFGPMRPPMVVETTPEHRFVPIVPIPTVQAASNKCGINRKDEMCQP